jgi:hypothetical protein
MPFISAAAALSFERRDSRAAAWLGQNSRERERERVREEREREKERDVLSGLDVHMHWR